MKTYIDPPAYKVIYEYLRNHQLKNFVEEGDDTVHFPLVDILSSGDTIETGLEEIENISEWLYVALKDANLLVKEHDDIKPLDYKGELYNANPECEHYVTANWSGVSCKKCGGWYCD